VARASITLVRLPHDAPEMRTYPREHPDPLAAPHHVAFAIFDKGGNPHREIYPSPDANRPVGGKYPWNSEFERTDERHETPESRGTEGQSGEKISSSEGELCLVARHA
jgi:hypothetical protein